MLHYTLGSIIQLKHEIKPHVLGLGSEPIKKNKKKKKLKPFYSSLSKKCLYGNFLVKYESSFWNNDSMCCQGCTCSFFLAIIASYAANARRATPIINFLATPTSTATVAMIICSLAIIASYAAFWTIYVGFENHTVNKFFRII